jgi:hypothetical protein
LIRRNDILEEEKRRIELENVKIAKKLFYCISIYLIDEDIL